MSKRRKLHFDTLTDALQDAEQLCDGYQRVANWSLGQICDHLGTAMIYSRDGFPKQKPPIMKWIARLAFLRHILNRRVIRLRLPAPIPAPAQLPDQEGVAFLATAIRKFIRPDTDFAEHCLLGPLTSEQWMQFHLWHCEHHLSFLIPVDEE